MKKQWQPLPAITTGDTSTTDQWNQFVTNINLLHSPNMAWAKANGTEPSVVWTLSAAAPIFRIPNITVTLLWSGRPLMAVWNLQYSYLSDPADLGLRLANSFNSNKIDLGHLGRAGGSARAIGGVTFVLPTGSEPTTPTNTDWWFEAYSYRGLTSGRSYSFHYNAKPGLLLLEIP